MATVTRKRAAKAYKKAARAAPRRDFSHPKTQKALMNEFTFALAAKIAKKNKEPLKRVLERMLAVANAIGKDQSSPVSAK